MSTLRPLLRVLLCLLLALDASAPAWASVWKEISTHAATEVSNVPPCHAQEKSTPIEDLNIVSLHQHHTCSDASCVCGCAVAPALFEPPLVLHAHTPPALAPVMSGNTVIKEACNAPALRPPITA